MTRIDVADIIVTILRWANHTDCGFYAIQFISLPGGRFQAKFYVSGHRGRNLILNGNMFDQSNLSESGGVDSGRAPLGPDSSSRKIIGRIDQSLELISEAVEIAMAPCEIPAITVIVPVYNEVVTLPKVLGRIGQVMPGDTEVIVVDDGSTDGTTAWLEVNGPSSNRKVFCRRCNHGKGSAVRLGIRHSRGRVVAIQDADLEYDPADLLSVIDPILTGDADVVYGSRYLDRPSDPSFVHRLGNKTLTAISNRLTGLQLTDMETCHKAFRGDLIRSIPLREPRFGFEPEITAKIAARGVRVQEIPTGYDCRSYDEGKKIGWRDGIAALACMWKYRRV